MLGTVATALADNRCERVLWASDVDEKKRYAITTGIAVEELDASGDLVEIEQRWLGSATGAGTAMISLVDGSGRRPRASGS